MAKFFLRLNEKPQIRDDSHGMWRRVRLIPFTRSFSAKPNPNLGAELAQEASGILRWALEGCLRWQHEAKTIGGLQHPNAVVAATKLYEAEQDPLTDFLGECCVQLPETVVRASALFEAYRHWAERTLPERDRMSLRTFGEKCKTRFDHKKNRDGIAYVGVGLRAKETNELF